MSQFAAIDIGASERACPVRFSPFGCAASFVDRAHCTPFRLSYRFERAPMALRILSCHVDAGLYRLMTGSTAARRGNNHLKRRLSRESWPMELQPISFIPRTISASIRPRARSTPA